jgi:hypothetical protein
MLTRRLQLVVVAAMLMASAVASYCGDGVPGYYSGEQCDAGMRSVARNDTLTWAGVGPSLGSRFVQVAFRYSVLDFALAGSGGGQPVYSLALTSGATPIASDLYAYELVCTDSAGDAVLELLPNVPDTETATTAAMVQWTYGATACSTALGGAWTPANLTAFAFRYNGVAATDVWLLTSGAGETHAFGPAAVVGTECCTAACMRTGAVANYTACPSGTPSGTAVPYVCQIDGECTGAQPVEPNAIYDGCGNGIVDAGEVCDAGLWLSGQIGTPSLDFNCPGIGGVISPPPGGSDLHDVCGKIVWSALTPNIYNASTMVASYGTPINRTVDLFANVTYTFTCTDIDATNMYFTLQPSIAFATMAFPAVLVNWYYTISDVRTNCSTFFGDSPTFNNWVDLTYQYMDLIFKDDWGNFTVTSGDSISRPWRPTFNPAGDECCGPSCALNFPNTTECDSGTPLVVPALDPYVCINGACIVSLSQTPTPSITATNTPTASVTPTSTVTASASSSTGASPSATPTASITASPPVTPTASPTALVTASPTQTPSVSASVPITPSASSSTGASATSTATATRTPTTTRTPTSTSGVSVAPTKQPSSDPAALGGAFGALGGVTLLLVVVSLLFLAYKAYAVPQGRELAAGFGAEL